MIAPALLVHRSSALGRQATPEDFTVTEREEVFMALGGCLHIVQSYLEEQPVSSELYDIADHLMGLQDAYEAFSDSPVVKVVPL